MRLALRAVGVLSCVAVALGIAAVDELPASLYAVAWKADPVAALRDRTAAPDTTVDWGDREIVVAFLDPVRYDEARDATLAGAVFGGDHRPAGPLVWVHGHVSGKGPFLLDPTSATLSFEDVDVPRDSPYAGRFAIAEPFDARAAMPPALFVTILHLAPLALLAFVVDGTRLHQALQPMAVALGGWSGFLAQAEGLGGILFSFVAVIVTATSTILVVVLLVWRKRIAPVALSGFAFGVAYFLTLAIAAAYAPHSGAGD